MRSANTFAYSDYYKLIYNKRNDSAHNFSGMKQKDIFAIITAGLVVYLDISRSSYIFTINKNAVK